MNNGSHSRPGSRSFVAKGTSVVKSSAKNEKKPRVSKSSKSANLEVDIIRLNDDGVGIGRFENKEVWVTGALPDEKVELAVEHKGQRRIVGRLRKVIKRHAQRISSPCRHARHCQGCSLVQLAYAAQLHFKEDKIRHALSSYPVLKEIKVAGTLAAPNPFGYRTNAKLVFGKVRGQVRIGLYRRGSHDVVDISDCPLHHPLLNRVVEVVREEVQRQRIFVYDPKTGKGLLRYLAIKVAPESSKVMVTFVTAERNFQELNQLGKWLQRKVPEVISIHQNINSSSGNVIFGRETLRIFGVHDLITQIGDIRLRVSPTSFFQVNDIQAARIYQLVRDWAQLTSSEYAFDFYCGIGGIALNLARDAAKVIGIEVMEAAVRNARENALLNKLENCDFRLGDATELLFFAGKSDAPGCVVILNPPRGGCDRKALETAVALSPRMLIYVSCNPETLARDLDILDTLGLQTEAVQPVDMFPQTPHVETLVRLRPKTDRAPRRSSRNNPWQKHQH